MFNWLVKVVVDGVSKDVFRRADTPRQAAAKVRYSLRFKHDYFIVLIQKEPTQ